MSEEAQEESIKVISSSIFSYWTYSMIAMLVGSIALVAFLFDTIWANFETNIPLNSVIFIVIFAALYKAFANNLELFKLTKFIEKIEKVENQVEVNPEDVKSLLDHLKSQGEMMDMYNMHMGIEKMTTYGRLTFTDKDAMLIKSKLGRRVRNERNVVSYMAGTLVMFGLIGTFWGLLITIASVGDAMGEVSKSMAAAGGGDASNMAEFIEGIAKPLQGMGIAFSSSLFGLTGSLYLGVLNFFAGGAQNRFMEDCSRWIDLHIPTLNPDLQKKTDKMKVPGSDDLKSWLAAFVYLSNKSSRRMSLAYSAMTQLVSGMAKTVAAHNELIGYQRDMQTSMSEMSLAMQNMQSVLSNVSESAQPLLEFHQGVNKNLEVISEHFGENQRQIASFVGGQQNLSQQIGDTLSQISKATNELGNIQKDIRNKFELSSDQTAQFDAKYNELAHLSLQVSKILEEIDSNNASMKDFVFPDEPEESDLGPTDMISETVGKD